MTMKPNPTEPVKFEHHNSRIECMSLHMHMVTFMKMCVNQERILMSLDFIDRH
jgi:hypothetical protein